MHLPPSSHSEPVVFTLSDDDAGQAVWERGLSELRSRRLPPPEADGDVVAPSSAVEPPSAAVLPPTAAPPSAPREPEAGAAPASAPFGDQELDAAYREYLRQAAAHHNEGAGRDADPLVLIEEDFIRAQQSLQSEAARRHLVPQQTFLLKQGGSLPEADGQALSEGAALPPGVAAVHVYALPPLPAGRRVRVISEQELSAQLQERLKQHLNQAVAGMVRRAVTRKMATFSHEIQMLLSEETEKLVDDILEHNLSGVMRSIRARGSEE